MPPIIEVLPSKGNKGTTGASSWYYSTAPPAQSVSAMPKPEDLRARKAKTTANANLGGGGVANPNTAGGGAGGAYDGDIENVKLDVATTRRINELEKVNWHDVQIKIDQPFSSKRPTSQNVRRIVASQKTFQNHLSDDIANHEIQAQNPLYKPEPYDPATTPLGYTKSVADPPANNATRYRRFCEICGYWGTIGCMRCGVRLCSGECEVTHREARCTRKF
ncbi:hypothetical protein TWF106_007723 [Orbilia oligospora]|uniref:HIT-type domain-containing protein n=1 Tax=Orbilia oligospora TaxID=2813651 RepID=A0A6G1M5R0_ORBOL|nr:hypothetical protein TWF788_001699 [Orbilia oligospora]KAF3196623.1 hypothetical protein TWF679_004718 [Orbilia oligospora]KAF3212167.1 hypothetical protein TWF191_010579 [Orbilia oligospora]KAF3218128.1 hypothetical protein TWF106_007723 [Orbilia oligospora]KAF3246412.1 hypothetical protein TWF192_006926 [Orbilia oligospora]